MLLDDILYNPKKVYIIPGTDTLHAPDYKNDKQPIKPKRTIFITIYAKGDKRNNNNQRRGSG